MSAGRSKATEAVLGASNVDSCEGSQLMSHIQQREAPFTDRDAHEQPLKVSYLGVFSCLACYLDRGNRRKLDPMGKKSKFIGYDEESKAYLLMDLETRQVMRARSVTFNEKIIPDEFMADSEPLQNLELSIEGCIDYEQPSTTKTSEARSAPTEGDAADSVGTTEENHVEEEAVVSHSTDRPVQRSVRIRNPPIRCFGTHASVTEI